MADRSARLAVIGFFLLALGALQLTIFEVLLHLNLLLAQQLVHHDLRTTCLLRSSWAGCFWSKSGHRNMRMPRQLRARLDQRVARHRQARVKKAPPTNAG